MAQIGKTYLYRIDGGYPGQLSRVFEAFMVIVSEYVGTKDGVGVGVPVKLDNGKIVPATATGDAIYGFTLRAFPSQSVNYQNVDNSFEGTQVWRVDQPAPVLKKGYFTMYCQAGNPVKEGDVYFRTQALGELVVGGIETGDAATGVMAAGGSNTGNGTAILKAVTVDATTGTVTVTFTSATEYGFTYSGTAYTGTAGIEFNEAGFQFTITSGDTAFVNGDTFTITISKDTNVAKIANAKFTGPKTVDGMVEIAYNMD